MSSNRTNLVAALQSQGLMETLAEIEHERWSHWQRYLHSQCRPGVDGTLIIPAQLVSRWTEQLSTPYVELPETEKESDREQVRRYLPAIEAVLDNID
jgi:hypothetical protein